MAEHDHHDDHDDDLHDRGLGFDVATLLDRRRALVLLGGVGLATVVGCAGGSNGAGSTSTTAGGSASSGATSTTAAATATASVTEEIPEETGGPYPADGSNGVNVLTESGIVRSDIRSSFGSSSGVADGVPLDIELSVLDASAGFTPLAGAAIYLWHCDREGRYSLYSQGAANENYLRGVQETDASGAVRFTSIYPACYSGRWPHIHFEIYPSLDEATVAGTKLRTTQLALPEDVCDTVYATDGYGDSQRNLSQVSLDTDMVFRDGYSLEMATVTGDAASGYVARLTLAV
jgi:protocatechuate 3,4-dioxygenase beta subunit